MRQTGRPDASFIVKDKNMRFRAFGPSLALVTLLAFSAPAYAETATVVDKTTEDAAPDTGAQAQEDVSRGDVGVNIQRRIEPQ